MWEQFVDDWKETRKTEMTREEAIKRLEWLRMVGNHVDSVTLGKEDMPYFDMAISALREQEERKPCKWCEDMDAIYEIVCYLPHDNGSATDIPLRFCPMCGRRLEEV